MQKSERNTMFDNADAGADGSRLSRRAIRMARRPVRPGIGRPSCKGAALVEAAIVMNIFLLFLFGILEFGHYVMVKQLMDNAARDGARLASTGTTTVTTAQIQALVTTELANQGPSSMNIQVFQADPTTGANVGTWSNTPLGSPIAVLITGNYQPMVRLASLIPVAIPIRSQAMVYSESQD